MRMALESRKVSSEFNSGGFVVFHTPANFRLRGCLMRTRGEMEKRSRRPPAPARWRPFTPGAAGAALRPDRDGAGSGPGRGGERTGTGGAGSNTPPPAGDGEPSGVGRARLPSSARKRWVSASSAFCRTWMRAAWWVLVVYLNR